MSKKQSRNRKRCRNSALDALPTAGKVLNNREIIEVVQPYQNGPLKLLVWDGKDYAVRTRVSVHGQQLIAPAIQNSVFENMGLPRLPQPFDSENWLLNCISEKISTYSGLSSELGNLIARFCLCTWVSEALPSRLSLHIIGPVTDAGIVLMDLLSCFCRHALFLAEIDVNSIAAMPRGLCPTVLYSGGLSPRTRNLLDSSDMRSKVVRARGQITPLEHMAVTYSSAIEDLPKSPTAIEIPILSARGDCPPLSRAMI